jgi:hypothetical protein
VPKAQNPNKKIRTSLSNKWFPEEPQPLVQKESHKLSCSVGQEFARETNCVSHVSSLPQVAKGLQSWLKGKKERVLEQNSFDQCRVQLLPLHQAWQAMHKRCPQILSLSGPLSPVTRAPGHKAWFWVQMFTCLKRK